MSAKLETLCLSIIQMAMDNIKEAYVMCLTKLAERAFTDKDKYFECYAQMLVVIKQVLVCK